jgi:hypothetical protein
MASVRDELGVNTAGAAGEHFAVFSARFYVTDGSAATGAQVAPSVAVRLFDSEEGTSQACAAFTDNGSTASIAKVFVVYPVANRPTWNAAQAVRGLAVVDLAVVDRLTVDFEIEYIRITTGAVPADIHN